LLQVEHLTAQLYGRRVLDDVSLHVERGTAVGLLGPNGAGKTTSFRAILGQVTCDSGTVRLDGQDIGNLPMHERARRGIGYLPQESCIFRGMSVAKNIMAVLELRPDLTRRGRKESLIQLLEELQLTHLKGQNGATLSGGERRRAEIARCLAADPAFVLLDEPFAGVDPISVGEIRSLVGHLTERNIGVLITDHNVRETLELCDRAYILDGGKVLAEGMPDEIIHDPTVRDVYLGEEFTL